MLFIYSKFNLWLSLSVQNKTQTLFSSHILAILKRESRVFPKSIGVLFFPFFGASESIFILKGTRF